MLFKRNKKENVCVSKTMLKTYLPSRNLKLRRNFVYNYIKFLRPINSENTNDNDCM